VAFVGPRDVVELCAQRAPTRAIVPEVVDHHAGGDTELMRARVRAHRPHVVVVFGAQSVPPGAFAGLDALTVGWEIGDGAGEPAAGFDRVVGRGAGAWRSIPLPVDDAVFGPVRPMGERPRVVFVGESTAERERWLTEVKHRFDVLHVAHGLHGARLLELFARVDVAINLHDGDQPGFEHRVPVHLAAGHLVLSAPLSPLHGLEPDLDFLEVRGPKQLEWAVEGLVLSGAGRSSVRVRGRRKAEAFRASRVYPRLLADLAADVTAFGSARR
jgi:hypothetical protein